MNLEWLTVIIILLMVGIALDGLRRMRNARRENIRLSKNAQKADQEGDAPVSSSEFPSGGARVASYRKDDEAKNLNENVRKSFEAKRVTVGAPQRIPEQVTLNLQESVPMLMDSVEEADEHAQSTKQSAKEERHTTAVDDQHEYNDVAADDETGLDDDYAEDADDAEEHYRSQTSREDFDHIQDDLDDDEDPLIAAGTYQPPEDDDPHHREPQLGDLSHLDDESERSASAGNMYSAGERAPKKRDAERASGKDKQKSKADMDKKSKAKQQLMDEEPQFVEPDEVLIMNIMARSGTRFHGQDLLQALMDEGLKLGAMDIFHRHLDNDGDAPVLFSLANMVVPGTFNLSEMQNFETPGISLFLSLPLEGGESIAAYDDLARTARNLARNLDGELKDENRSVMTNQTIEHGRQRVIEYERRKKLARV